MYSEKSGIIKSVTLSEAMKINGTQITKQFKIKI